LGGHFFGFEDTFGGKGDIGTRATCGIDIRIKIPQNVLILVPLLKRKILLG
jgi:hypothetical protein